MTAAKAITALILTAVAPLLVPFGITLDMSLETVIGLLVNGLVVMAGVYFTRNKQPIIE
jgi:hypothetical protein